MIDTSTELGRVLDLERIDKDVFRGLTPPGQNNRVYGGQVVAQALSAAYRSIEGRICASLHSYFIRPGDPKVPILYMAERARDGGSFSVRRVVALQEGAQIFNLSAIFQEPEQGFEHAVPMPAAPSPDGLLNEEELRAQRGEDNEWSRRIWPIEVKPVDPQPDNVAADPAFNVWFRARQEIGADVALNQCVLAYASDMTLLDASLRPHPVDWNTGRMQVASLDHALWFHRPSHLADWHLFVQESPSASGGRGFNRGTIYAADGTLVASATQEALIRYRPNP